MTNEQNATAYEGDAEELARRHEAVAETLVELGGLHSQDARVKMHHETARALRALSSPPAAGDAVAWQFRRKATIGGWSEWRACDEGFATCAPNDDKIETRALYASPAAPPPDADWVMVPRDLPDTLEAEAKRLVVVATGLRHSGGQPDLVANALMAKADGIIQAAAELSRNIAAAPKPAAPPSVTDAVRALVAKWRKHVDQAENGGAGYVNTRDAHEILDELEALTHPGHKHAERWRIDLDEDQVRELFAFIASAEEGEFPPVSLLFGDGHSGRGLYMAHSEYPEEGAELLAPVAFPLSQSFVDRVTSDPADEPPCIGSPGHKHAQEGAAQEAKPWGWAIEFSDPDPQFDVYRGKECPEGWAAIGFPLYLTPIDSEAK